MKTVLYVDDEPALLDIARLFLEKTSEFKVLSAESAKEGLEIIRTDHPDAIVSDYQMPGMDGIEFLKAVRRNYTTPFIMFTGRGSEMIAMEATNSGADYYIQKGGDPRALFAELTYKIRLALSDRRDETEEQRSKKTIRTLIDKTYNAVIIHNEEGRILEVNSKLLEMFQITREEALKYSIDDLSGPKSPAVNRTDIIQKVLLGEDQFLIWDARRPHDGSIFPIETFLTRINFGKNFYILCNIRDISNKGIKDEIESVIVSAADNAPDGIICTNGEGRILYMNKTWSVRLGIILATMTNPVIFSIDSSITPEILSQYSTSPDGTTTTLSSVHLGATGQVHVDIRCTKQTQNNQINLFWYVREKVSSQ